MMMNVRLCVLEKMRGKITKFGREAGEISGFDSAFDDAYSCLLIELRPPYE